MQTNKKIGVTVFSKLHYYDARFDTCSGLINRLRSVQLPRGNSMLRLISLLSAIITLLLVSGCSKLDQALKPQSLEAEENVAAVEEKKATTIWDALNRDFSTTPVKVNRYIWQASLEVLDFMPIETIDPFSGVIVMGYGVPPGGNNAYRATVYVSEPALDARTLRVAVATRTGPVPSETMRALEDAILSRARQLRELDGRF